MNEFLNRQFAQIRQSVIDYKNSEISLNSLINRIEAIGRIIGDEFWDKQMFPIVLDLERINSEIIDKHRQLSESESTKINIILNQLENILVASG